MVAQVTANYFLQQKSVNYTHYEGEQTVSKNPNINFLRPCLITFQLCEENYYHFKLLLPDGTRQPGERAWRASQQVKGVRQEGSAGRNHETRLARFQRSSITRS